MPKTKKTAEEQTSAIETQIAGIKLREDGLRLMRERLENRLKLVAFRSGLDPEITNES